MIKNRDFTVEAYSELLKALIDAGYRAQTFKQYLQSPAHKTVILRHDVDRRPLNALRFAKLEKDMGLESTYFFRIVPEVFKPSVIRAIAGMGHEIGYHYEDMDPAKGDPARAIVSFKKNLELLRKHAEVDTICMHGSPLSKYDNKDLWQDYSYRDYSILGEPYFDLDYSKIFYITDTSRRWNDQGASIRDKVKSPFQYEIQSTWQLIELIREDALPQHLMINTHPQRWDDQLALWARELVWQSVKNVVKGFVSRRSR